MDKQLKIEDIELMDRIRSGDETALKLIYNKYWNQLFASAFNVLHDQHVCEDIIQEIFINLWNKREMIEIRVSLKSYLFIKDKHTERHESYQGRISKFIDHQQ